MFANIRIIILLLSFPTTVFAVRCDVSTSVFSFPAYDALSISSTDSSGQITVQCDPGQPFQVKLNAGLYASGNFNVREMQSAETQTPLRYNLFLDPSYSQVWGDGQGFSLFYQGVGSVAPFRIPIFGRISPAQRVGSGQYSDSVIVTIEW